MPSKSKAQARLFAAAAHNPEIAKKVGISQKAAKEWNHADKEAGTLKKSSDKPEHVKEEDMQESSMRQWADIVQNAELEHNIDDADEQTLIHTNKIDEDDSDESDDPEDQEYDLQGKPVQPGQRSAPVNAGTSTERLEEMPERFDAFKGQDPDDFVSKTAKLTSKNNMIEVAKHDDFTVFKSKNGTGYIAYDNAGNEIAIVSGYVSGKIFHEEAIAQKSTYSGVVYQIYMDIIKEGYRILSDTLHSDSAINFWKKLIQRHEVYVVGDGKILAKATPDKFNKYWGSNDSPSAELQLLLVK